MKAGHTAAKDTGYTANFEKKVAERSGYEKIANLLLQAVAVE